MDICPLTTPIQTKRHYFIIMANYNNILILLLLIIYGTQGGNGNKLSKRQRKAIEEISESDLKILTNTYDYVAILFHDDSKVSAKTLHDLGLINNDSEIIGNYMETTSFNIGSFVYSFYKRSLSYRSLSEG